MAREDKSQKGAPSTPPSEFRSRVGLDRVAELDRRHPEPESEAPTPSEQNGGPHRLLDAIRRLFRNGSSTRRPRGDHAPSAPAEASDEAVHASPGRSATRRAPKKVDERPTHATRRGAASSGEHRKTGTRPAARVAESEGTKKTTSRRGKSTKRREAR